MDSYWLTRSNLATETSTAKKVVAFAATLEHHTSFLYLCLLHHYLTLDIQYYHHRRKGRVKNEEGRKVAHLAREGTLFASAYQAGCCCRGCKVRLPTNIPRRHTRQSGTT